MATQAARMDVEEEIVLENEAKHEAKVIVDPSKAMAELEQQGASITGLYHSC